MSEIKEFRGEYRWLSNFHIAPVTFNGVEYRSSEHAYQAAKADNEEDKELIRKTVSPYSAKQLGKSVAIKNGWDSVKLDMMTEIVRAKFFQNEDLAKKLIETGDQELIEGNTWNDSFWGKCDGHGENHLGKILMKIREELLEAEHPTSIIPDGYLEVLKEHMVYIDAEDPNIEDPDPII